MVVDEEEDEEAAAAARFGSRPMIPSCFSLQSLRVASPLKTRPRDWLKSG